MLCFSWAKKWKNNFESSLVPKFVSFPLFFCNAGEGEKIFFSLFFLWAWPERDGGGPELNYNNGGRFGGRGITFKFEFSSIFPFELCLCLCGKRRYLFFPYTMPQWPPPPRQKGRKGRGVGNKINHKYGRRGWESGEKREKWPVLWKQDWVVAAPSLPPFLNHA